MQKSRVRYTVRIPEPGNHQVEVEVRIDDAPEGGLFLEMPVWTPGSYLVREYSRHVSGVAARRVSGDPVPVLKTEKNVWRVDAKPGKRVDVVYTVYANELTVRTSHVDADHAFLHPTATFLYVRGREAEPMDVAVEAPEGWRISTGLPLVGDDTFRAADLDHLLDSPFEVGAHEVLRFEVEGVPHRIAIHGEGNFDREELLGDTHTICRTAAEMFPGGHPSESYTFIYHVLQGAGGGLEHKDSCVCGFGPRAFKPARSYKRQMSLISHEYFHLWNVKRIRPRELGPFAYGRENYTRLLWVAEGFTSYFQDVILRRADLASVPVFLDDLALSVRTYLEMPGREVEPMAEASFDAWIKLYRPHENSRNATISYYLKGALVAWLLDLTIRAESGGERSLEDVMRALWSRYRARPDEGFTEEELLEDLETAAGRSLALEIEAWVHGTEPLPFEETLARFGLELRARSESEEPRAWLGITTKEEGGRSLVREVLAGSPAQGVLDAGDELIALNGWRLGSVAERLDDLAPGEEAAVTIARRGRIRKVRIECGEAPLTDVVIRPREDAGDAEAALFEGWLGEKLSVAGEEAGPAPKDLRPRPV